MSELKLNFWVLVLLDRLVKYLQVFADCLKVKISIFEKKTDPVSKRTGKMLRPPTLVDQRRKYTSGSLESVNCSICMMKYTI